MGTPELGQAGEHLPPLWVLRVFLQSSGRAGEEEQLIIIPKTLIWGIEHFSASLSPGKSKSMLHLQQSSSRLGSGKGLSLPLELGENWIKDWWEQRERDSQPVTEAPGSIKGETLQTLHIRLCTLSSAELMENAKIKDFPSAVYLIPSSASSAHIQFTFHLLPQPSAGREFGIFTSPQASPQGSYILRSVLGFIQPPCSNVSTEESSEPPSCSQPWQLFHTNKCKCRAILLLLTRLATSLKLCREPARRKQPLDQASLLRK